MKNREIEDLADNIRQLDFDNEYQEFLALSGPISMDVEDLENSLQEIFQFFDQHMEQQKKSLSPPTDNSEPS